MQDIRPLDIVKTACSKPIKTKSAQNGLVGPSQNLRSRREDKREEHSRKGKQLATEILDCKPAAAKCEMDPKTVHATFQTRFGGESEEMNLSRYPKVNRLTLICSQNPSLKMKSSKHIR